MHFRNTIAAGAMFLVGYSAIGQLAPLNHLSLNEGLRMQIHTPYVEDPENPPPPPEETDFTVNWWVHSGRTYYLEGTDDLATGEWKNLLSNWPSHFVGEYANYTEGSFSSAKFFVRLRYVEGRRMALSHSYTADTDHDGVADINEMNGTPRQADNIYIKTHPLNSEDDDDDGLPDDWELRRFHQVYPEVNTDEDPTNNVNHLYLEPDSVIDSTAIPPITAYQKFKTDWVVGLHLEYGGQFFWYASADSTPLSYLYRGDQEGALRVTYSDPDHTRIQSLAIYPVTEFTTVLFNHPIELTAEPTALYTWVEESDPTRSGYSFSASPGYSVIRNPHNNLVTGMGPPDGRPAPLDLLRTVDRMEHPAGAPRPRGATRPVPFKRALLDGTTPRRIPRPLAITSLPVTEIGRDRFPVIIREASNLLPHVFQDLIPNYVPTPGSRMVENTWEPNPVARTLDEDGLPYGIPNPDFYPSAGPYWFNRLMFRSPLTFARWYRDNSARGYVLQGINTPFTPPDQEITFGYGFYSGQDGFYPHRHEVRDISKFTTEMHCRLDYTADTQLFIETNDDCWVFADGKLARDLDFGGIPERAFEKPIDFALPTVALGANEADYPDRHINIKEQLGLTASSGSLRLAVFHADRFTSFPLDVPYAQLRFLSTSPLLPIYCYQVVAESATQQPLTFSFGLDPQTQQPIAPAGMTMDPKSGKILWDLYQSPAVAPGTYPVTVVVSDPLGNSDTQQFTLNVID